MLPEGGSPVRRLWIADVHANLPAFEAVLADAGTVDDVVFLGDIVGCGPHPSACLDLLTQLGGRAVLGNHDTSVLAIRSRSAARSDPVDWDEWTFDRLSASQKSYLASLPAEISVVCCGEEARAVHHLPGAPYLHPDMPDAVFAPHLEPIAGPLVLCGHSHRQIDRTVNGVRLVCVPPIGQPRNGDTRAGYAIESDGALAYRLVPYDVDRVLADIGGIGLAPAYCQRWARFVRTGFDREWSRDYRPGRTLSSGG